MIEYNEDGNHKRHTSKLSKVLMTLILLCALIFGIPKALTVPVYAEGSSVDVYLALNKSVLNIGKTFTLTFKVRPNSSLAITSFDAEIHYDTTRFDLVTAVSAPKITKPSGVPVSFDLSASVANGVITILGNDPDQTAPIQTKGAETSLITFAFSVKDAAKIGTASFFISNPTIAQNTNSGPVEVPATIISPKTVSVEPRLETNAYLSGISAGAGTLNPAFSKDVTKYSLEVPVETTSIDVTAKSASTLAKISISGGKDLKYGENKVTISVKAQDPDVIKIYTITVVRLSPEATPTIEPTVTEEPTLEPTQEPIEITPTTPPVSSSLPDNTPKGATDNWKNIALIFMGLFLITLAALIWMIIERAGEHKKVVKIRRL